MKRFLLILSILFLLGAVENVSAQKKSAKLKKTKTITVNCGVCNQKAIYLPKPEYPQTAKFVNASGAVVVQILLGEKGNVLEAKAVSGHSFLRAAAVEAALKAKFEPFLLSRKPVRAYGLIVYNFVSNEIFQPQKAETSKRKNFFPVCSDCSVLPELISLPKPEYPKEAITGNIVGKITVQIVIDEQGNVIEAKAVSGNPLFFEVSVKAAFKAKFKPAVTITSRRPVKSSGIIVFNFAG